MTKKDETGISKAESLSKPAVRKVLNEKHNHRGRGLTDPEKKKRYAEYEKRKKVVFEIEKRNMDYLVLFLASDGVLDENREGGEHDATNYYVMGGNSALIYVSDIAGKIGRNSKLHSDDDASPIKFKTGIAKIKGLKKFTEALGGIGIERQLTKSGDEIAYFKLKKAYDKKELKTAVKKLKAMREENNALLYGEVLHPTLHKLILQLRVMLYRKIKATNAEYRVMMGQPMAELLFELNKHYVEMVRGVIDDREGLVRMRITMDRISDMVAMMQELDLWDVLFVVRTAETIVKIQKNIDELIVVYDKKRLKDENHAER
ncbi:hypothetical protein IJG92_00740 [Candidatus Saccharibacteria bacterium]|nr:hypothetical protein [Candidatus Saccharibacteria bacterium]MBQ6149426.1 hypothetical protein [Candidatus Saccharibacteria bacterium]